MARRWSDWVKENGGSTSEGASTNTYNRGTRSFDDWQSDNQNAGARYDALIQQQYEQRQAERQDKYNRARQQDVTHRFNEERSALVGDLVKWSRNVRVSDYNDAAELNKQADAFQEVFTRNKDVYDKQTLNQIQTILQNGRAVLQQRDPSIGMNGAERVNYIGQLRLQQSRAQDRLWNGSMAEQMTAENNPNDVKEDATRRLEALRKQNTELKRQNKLREFETAMQNPDYAENSKYQTTANGKQRTYGAFGATSETGFNDITYDLVNKNQEAIKARQNMNPIVSDVESREGTDQEELQRMTDDEVQLFNYLYAQNPDKARDYLNTLRPDLMARQSQYEQEEWQKRTEENFVGSSLLSVPARFIGGLDALAGMAADKISGRELDTNAGYLGNMKISNAIRQKGGEMTGEWLSNAVGDAASWRYDDPELKQKVVDKFGGAVKKFGNTTYGSVMSQLDQLWNLGMTGGMQNAALVLMASSAMPDAIVSAKEQGLSDKEAFGLGAIAGVAEYFTEKVSLEALLDMESIAKNGFLKYVAKAGLAEGSEEVASDFINFMAQEAIAGENSDFKRNVKEYQRQGMSHEEAVKAAWADQLEQSLHSFLGGALAGGGMAVGMGGSYSLNEMRKDRAGAEIKQNLPDYSPLQNMDNRQLAEYVSNVQQTQQMDQTSENVLRQAAEQMVSGEEVMPELTEAIMTNDNTLGMLEQETETEINSEEEMMSALRQYAGVEAEPQNTQAEPQQNQTEQTAAEESSPKPQNVPTGVSEALIDNAKSEQKKDSDREIVVNYAENFAKAGMMNIGIAIDDNYNDNYDVVEYNKAVNQLVEAGYNGNDFPNTILPMKAATAIYDAAMKERSVQNVRTETNGLRRDAGRTYGQNTGRQGRGVEGRTGETYQGTRQDGLRGSEARTGVTFEEEVRSAQSLNLKNGTAEGKVRFVDSGLSNADAIAKSAVERAFPGTSVKTFGFGSLTFEGGIQARGSVSGNQIFAKIDHDRFTGASIIYHESSHKYIDQLAEKHGDRKAVVEQLYSDICKEYKGDYINKTFWKPYKEAYEGSGLEDWQIKEELICDLNGGMNEIQYMEGYSKAKNATKKVEGVIHGVHQKHIDRLMKMGLEANANTQTENGQVFESRDLDSEGRQLSEGQMEFYKNVAPELRDENGNIKPYFHGTGRADRVGTVFLPERATSGPMAFFTDDREIAERYSKDKADTSLAYEDANNYHKQFVVDVDGEEILLEDYWNILSPSEKDNYRKRAGQITYDDDYEFTVDENVSNGNGGYGADPVLVRQAKGNAFRMLVDAWLDSGDLYGEEERFLDILNLLGIENARYKDPNARVEGVYEVYLNVTRPFVTTEVDEDFASDVEDWLDNTDWEEYVNESWNADEWDKNNIDPYDWLDRLRRDIENNTTYAWTSIPDAITAYLKENGYDGIVDQGGKTGGYGHQVVIPFYSEQIKDIDNLNPTENPDIRYSRELDAQYMYAVNSGDMETAQRMVEQAARETGYNTPKLYHGTPNFGFTTFDLTRGEMLIFATTNPKTAETYSGETNRTKISERSSLNVDDLSGEDLLNEAKKRWKKYDEYRLMTPEEKESNLEKSRSDVKYFAQIIEKYVAEHEQDFNNETREIANKMAESINRLGDSKNDLDAYTASSGFNDSMWDLKWIDEDLQLDLLQAINDAGSLDNAERRLHDFMYRGDIYQNTVFDHDYVFDNQLALKLDAEQRKGIYGLYGRTDNQLVIDAEGANWNQIKPPEELELYGTQITRTIATAAERKGYDSVLLRNLKDNGGNTPYNGLSDVYIYFNSNQLKSADPVTYDDDGNVIPLSERFNLENDDIRFSRETSPAFYSQLERMVEAYKGDKIGASSLIPYLKGKGVKDEEIKWTGIQTFLEGKKSVSKTDVLDYIRDNGLQIEDVELSSGKSDPFTWSNGHDEVNEKDYYDYDGELIGDEDAFKERARREAERWGDSPDDLAFEFEHGHAVAIANESDRVVLEADQPDIYELMDAGFSQVTETYWQDYKLQGGTNYREVLYKIPGSDYSNVAMKMHWSSKNKGVLAHARVQDFNDGKVLFVEEIQSDLHNAGKKEGYKSDVLKSIKDVELKLKKGDGYEVYGLYVNGKYTETGVNRATLEDKGEEAVKKELLDFYISALSRNKAPDAPFKNNYTDFVLKDLLRKAAEEGYEFLAWTTAQMQADRWSDEFMEGYRIEYDQEIPKFLKKYGKQWGAQLTEVPLEEAGESAPAIPITDAMRESVLTEGQPMFSRELGMVREGNQAVMTTKRIDDMIEDSGAGSRDDYARWWITSISPSDFIDMTTSRPNLERMRFDQVDYDYMEGLKKSRQTPFLYIEYPSGKVVGHEGRHRMRALEKAGIKSVEIAVGFYDEDGYWAKTLNGEWNPLKTIDTMQIENQFGTYRISHIDNIIPLNKSTRDEVLANYGEDHAKEGDVRYSRDVKFEGSLPEDLKKMADAYDSLKKDYKQLQTENRKNKGRAEYFKGETKLNVYSDNPQVSSKAAEKIAKGYVKTYNLEMDKEGQAELTRKIRKYAEDYLTGKKDFDQLADEVLPLANEIVRNAKEIYESPEKEMIDHIWNTKIKISDTVRTDIPGYAAWKRGYAGKMKISTMDGMPIEDFYRELQDAYGSTLFPDDIMNPTDMLLHIADITDTLGGDQVYNYSDIYDTAEATQSVAFEIMQDVMSMDLHKTFADREKEKRDKLKKDMQQKAQESIKAVREHREKKLQALKDHYKEVAENKRIRREESADRKALLKVAQRLKKMKTTKANRELIDQMIGELDTVAVSITKGKVERLKGLREWYKEQFDDPDFLRNMGIEDEIDRLEKMQIKDMDIEDVRALTNILKVFEHKLRTENKLIRDADKRDTFAMGMEIMDHVNDSKGTRLGKLDDWLFTRTLTPERFFHRITDYFDEDPMYRASKNLSKGQRDSIAYTMNASSLFNKWTSDRKFIDRMMGKKAETIKIAPGVEITPAMRMSLYLHSKNDDNMRHIQFGGVRVPDMKLYKKGKLKEAYAKGKLVKLTRSQITRMAMDMSEQEKAAADAMFDYFNGMSQEAINNVSEDLYGYSLAEVENYFPINADKNYTRGSDTYQDYIADSTIEGMGFLKNRIKAQNPIMLRDSFEVLTQSINDTAKFVGLAIPVSNFKKLWNVQAMSFDETTGEMNGYSGSVKDAIERMYPVAGNQYINNMLMDLEGTGRKSRSDFNNFVNKIRSNYAGAVLTLNLSVAMKQAASYPTAASVIGWKPLIKALGNTRLSGKIDLDLIKKYTPLLYYRMQGYSTQELGDIKQSNNFMNRLISNHKALNWIQAIDIATTKKLWKAAEYYVRDNFKGLEVGSDAYYRQVADVYNEVIEETQPNYTVMQRPDWLRDDNALLQSILMFKTQPFQNFNVLYDAIGNFQAKNRHYLAMTGSADKATVEQALNAKKLAQKKLGHAVSALLVSTLVFASMTFAYNMLRRKKKNYEEEDGNTTAQSIATGIGKDMASSIAGMVPFGSEAWELISSLAFGDKYYGLNSVTITALSDFMESSVKLIEEAGDIINTKEKTGAYWQQKRVKIGGYINDVSKAFGIPVENVSKLATIITKWAMQTKGQTLADFYEAYLEKGPEDKKTYIDLLQKAYDAKDMDAYKEMYDVLVRDDALSTEKTSTADYIADKMKSRVQADALKQSRNAAGISDADSKKYEAALVVADKDNNNNGKYDQAEIYEALMSIALSQKQKETLWNEHGYKTSFSDYDKRQKKKK